MKYAKVYFEDVKVGDELPPLVKGPIQQIQLTRYAGASGDFNPIHQDDEFAKAAGMGGVFAHGMLSMGFVGQAVTDWAGATAVRKLGVRFAAIVRLKDVVTCRGRVLAKSRQGRRSTSSTSRSGPRISAARRSSRARRPSPCPRATGSRREPRHARAASSPARHGRAAGPSRRASRVESKASLSQGMSVGASHSRRSFSAHVVSVPPVARAV